MKRTAITLFFTCFLGLSAVFSQTVNGVSISDINAGYIQIVGDPKLLSNKVAIELDFGQETSLLEDKDKRIKDENGETLFFNSMIDALNFLIGYGYEFVDAYSNQNDEYHYILRKKKV